MGMWTLKIESPGKRKQNKKIEAAGFLSVKRLGEIRRFYFYFTGLCLWILHGYDRIKLAYSKLLCPQTRTSLRIKNISDLNYPGFGKADP